MGSRILQSVYTDTVFNTELILHPEQGRGDNFDLIHLTAEKLFALRPILKPNVSVPLHKAMRSHVETALWQRLATFYPEASKNEEKGTEDNQPDANNSDDEYLPWPKDLRNLNKITGGEMQEVGEDTFQAPNDTMRPNEADVIDQNVEGCEKRTGLISKVEL